MRLVLALCQRHKLHALQYFIASECGQSSPSIVFVARSNNDGLLHTFFGGAVVV